MAYFWFTSWEASGITPVLPTGMTWFSPSQFGAGLFGLYSQWAWGIEIGLTVVPGTYTIATVANTPLTITVVPAPATRPVSYVPAGTQVGGVQALLDNGADVELLPGLYAWATSLRPPDGSTLRSAGATIVALPNVQYGNRLFEPQGAFTLEGVTLTSPSERLLPVYIHTSAVPFTGRITVRRCTLRRGVLARLAGSELLVEDCTFINATAEVPSRSVFRGNLFQGPNAYGVHPWFNTGADGCLCVTNRWQQTSRGMVFQTGDACGTVAIENYFTGIRGGQLNANEVILMEAGVNGDKVPSGTTGIHHHTFVKTYITDCAGPGISLFGSGMHDNWWYESEIRTDAASLSLVALNGGAMGITGVDNIEVSGALTFTGKVGQFKASSLHVIETLPRHGGDAGSYPAIYQGRLEGYPITADAIARATAQFQFTGCGYVGRTGYLPLTALPALPPKTRADLSL